MSIKSTKNPKDSFDDVFANKQIVMVVMAHPDDLEVFCGGTVARLVKEGKRVVSVKITTGNRGSRGATISLHEMVATRAKEDAMSMELLGVQDSINLGVNDGEVEDSYELIGKLAYQMRKFQPELIITTNPERIIIRHSPGVNWVSHRDHRNAAMCALDAAYPYSRDRSFFPEHFKDAGIAPAKCTEFLITDSWGDIDEVLIGVDDFVDTRSEALSCHASQYSKQHARQTVDFFTQHEGIEGRFEKFLYVIAD